MNQCRKCNIELTDINWNPSQQKNYDYICKECTNTQRRENHHAQGVKPMSESKASSAFFGVHVAERLVSKTFKNVERMPYGHKGYDFICNRGCFVDSKSSCRHINKKQADSWVFVIKKNTIADYFFCIAFDNRESLNPLHIWLVPGKDVNYKITASIAESTIHKWDKYRIDKMAEITQCCNTLRSG